MSEKEKKIDENSREYWAGRQEYLTERLLNKGEKFYEDLTKEYERAINGINDEIERFYARFAINNAISLAEAKKILTTQERRKFQLKLKDYIAKGKTLNYSDEWAQTLENASTVFRVSRLQETQLHLHQIIEELTASAITAVTSHLGGVYEEGYYLQLYELAKGMKAAVRFDRVNQAVIDKLVAKPWAPDGYVFSERIWQERTKLNYFLETRLTQGVIRGENRQNIINDMADKMDTSKYNAGRLIMTETAYFSSAATHDGYKKQGLEKYEFLATLDFKTSQVCQDWDGEVMEVKDYRPGTNAPPMHVWCRSTTIPVVDTDIWGEDDTFRAARGANGQYERVPANITYKDWFSEYAN